MDAEARIGPLECQGEKGAFLLSLRAVPDPSGPALPGGRTPTIFGMNSNPARAARFLVGALLAGALATAGPPPAGAQETEGPLSPAGRLRLEVAPVFQAWDARFAPGGTEPLGADLTDPTGHALFPQLGALEETLRGFLGAAGFEARLGASSARVSNSRIRIPFRLDVGVLDWLTLGATVPIVQNRAEVSFAFLADSSVANVGVSPAVRRGPDVLAFTDALRARAEEASSRAEAVCTGAPGSAECASATALAEEGEGLLTGFLSTYSASPFFPLETSAAAATLGGRVDAFDERLVAAGLAPLGAAPLFATARLAASDFATLLSDGAVGVNTGAPGNRVGQWALGDVELHAALRLLEGGAAGDATGGLAYQVGAGALVRLGTGTTDDPEVLLDLGTGDGQIDIEGRVFSNVRSGRFGLWSDLRYGVQRPRTLTRRVGPAELPFVPQVNRATVEWTPGDYLQLELSPRYHFTDELAFTAGYRLFRKGEDGFVRLTPAPEPADLAPFPTPPIFTDVLLLAEGTEERLHEVGAGLVLSTLDAWRAGRASLPFEARFGVRWAAAGEGRMLPTGVRATFGLRLYRRLWGG